MKFVSDEAIKHIAEEVQLDFTICKDSKIEEVFGILEQSQPDTCFDSGEAGGEPRINHQPSISRRLTTRVRSASSRANEPDNLALVTLSAGQSPVTRLH